ncbi:GW dipeptide domain-containing protein [Geomonas propionica]|uniref:SH3-like domain-containing protein n=1 Tax=Geomonas propionica TaxID=2798582 RepID=A0ABS0YXX7_9BACT|nr:GW dipeptide domain-containing protein [Geomonas propionica]MBJ6802819.1 SH3-like domain-containing protein [Geomonas propionica]
MNLTKVAMLTYLFVSLLSCLKENRSVLAIGAVPLYNSEQAAVSGTSSGALYKGQLVEVVETIDVKHYQIYKVRLPSGKLGYINDGTYKVLDGNGSIR